jgi:hypothetical protein
MKIKYLMLLLVAGLIGCVRDDSVKLKPGSVDESDRAYMKVNKVMSGSDYEFLNNLTQKEKISSEEVRRIIVILGKGDVGEEKFYAKSLMCVPLLAMFSRTGHDVRIDEGIKDNLMQIGDVFIRQDKDSALRMQAVRIIGGLNVGKLKIYDDIIKSSDKMVMDEYSRFIKS